MSFSKLPKELESQIKGLLVNCASKNEQTSFEARETLASIYSASLSRVLDVKRNATSIFTGTEVYTGTEAPEIPIDTYFNIGEGAFRIWSNGWAGGLQYNELSGEDDFRFRPFTMSSAIAWDKKYAEAARLNVVQKGIQRLFDELIIKSDYLAFGVIAEALGGARTGNKAHVIQSFAKENSAGHKFQIEDVNRLKVLMKRLNQSWANGSTTSSVSNLTDLYLSPEMMGDVRRMAYNPMNTTVVPAAATTATALGLPDGVREEIFRTGGASSIWDINLHEMAEFGLGGAYNQLFYGYYDSATAATPAAPTWNPSTDEIILGVDRNMDAFASIIQADARGNTFQLEVDDQHLRRSRKMGYFGDVTQGYAVGNDRALVGLIV